MAGTFSQIYLQFVFAVKYRECLIAPSFRERLNMYITGIVRNRGSKMLAVNCMPDHTHIFVGFKPNMEISDLVKEIKVESNQFINQSGNISKRFAWQEGYGVFSYSQSHIDRVIRYILNQERHHQKQTFKAEYEKLLTMFNIEYDPRYVFEFFGGQ